MKDRTEVSSLLHLLLGAVDVRVVHGQAAHPGQPVHHAGLLVPVDGAELEQPQRQLPVRPAAGPVDQVVHRAVHRLEVVLAALELHRREHRVRVVRQVARGLEQVRLGDVRGVDERVARRLMPQPRVVLHLAADDPALGVEDRQAGADLLGEGEQVELRPELAVVAPLGLLEQLQVVVLGGAGLPGGAVDPLQLRVLLAPAPVRAGVPHQLERGDLPGGRHVRAPAEVLPAQLAGLRVDVVVDGQHARADFGGRLVVGPGRALDADQLELERLGRQLLRGRRRR